MNTSDYCEDFIVPYSTEHQENKYRNQPWKLWAPDVDNFKHMYSHPDIFMAINNNNNNGIYHIHLKKKGFRTEEISIKNGKDMITIECSRPEEYFNGGWETCHILRRIPVPKSVNMEKIHKWVSDKTFTILAPMNHECCKSIDKPLKLNKTAKQQKTHKEQEHKELQQKKQTQNQQTVLLPNQDSDEAKLEAGLKDLSVQPSCTKWEDTENFVSCFYDAEPEPVNIDDKKNVNNISEKDKEKTEKSPDISPDNSEDSYDLVSNEPESSETNAGDNVAG